MLYEFDNQPFSEFGARSAEPNLDAGPSDEELMERIKARDQLALSDLIRRYDSILRCVAGKMLSIDQDVTDTVEEVFLGIWNAASNFDTSKGRPLGWIITMTRRRAIDRVRRRQAYDRAEMRFRLSTETGSQQIAPENVEEHALDADRAQVFAGLISRLPEAQQRVLHMAFYEGLSQREIAKVTGIPLGTVKTRLELGIKKLRTAVSALATRDEWLNAA